MITKKNIHIICAFSPHQPHTSYSNYTIGVNWNVKHYGSFDLMYDVCTPRRHWACGISLPWRADSDTMSLVQQQKKHTQDWTTQTERKKYILTMTPTWRHASLEWQMKDAICWLSGSKPNDCNRSRAHSTLLSSSHRTCNVRQNYNIYILATSLTVGRYRMTVINGPATSIRMPA